MCSACGKICYATRQEARVALAAIRRRRRRSPENKYYWCERCQAYHTTSSRMKER